MDLQEKDRLISDEVWAMNPKSVTDSFTEIIRNINQRILRQTLWTTKMMHFFAGYYQIKQNRMKAVVDSLWKNENMANQTAHSLIKYNPVQKYRTFVHPASSYQPERLPAI